MAERRQIRLTVNGQAREGRAEPRRLLVDFLREDLALTGTHVGCEHGICGACTILLNGEAVRSCLMLAVQADGAELMTVEGLARGAELHPLQQAWIDEQVPQCGFCQNGQIMTAKALLDRNPHPTDAQIRAGMAGTLCRCMTYYRIQAAIRRVAQVGA